MCVNFKLIKDYFSFYRQLLNEVLIFKIAPGENTTRNLCISLQSLKEISNLKTKS